MPDIGLRPGNGPRSPTVTEPHLFLCGMTRHHILSAAATLALAVAAAGCGGTKSPGVADVGSASSTTTTSSSTSPPTGGSGSSAGPGGGSSTSMKLANGAK